MKIAIIGASGKTGNLILNEAVNRGHDVTAIVRNKDSITTPHVKIIEKDLFKLTYNDIEDNEVIIDAFGTWSPDSMELHQTSLQYLCDMLHDKPNRLLIVGGAGSLYVDPEHTIQVKDTPDFPDSFKPLASSMSKALDVLRTRNDVQWTYLSPAGDFQADGARSGKYTLGGEELILNTKNESIISYADYAIAMVDESENGNYIRKRFSVVSDY